MFHVTRETLAGRDHLRVSVTGAPSDSVESEARYAFRRALELIEAEGFSPRNIVRSRLFARDSESRKAAGTVRLEALSGALRGASSSYVDPHRLPEGASVQIDLIALAAAPGAEKHIQEYEPAIAPPMFVALDGLIYLSGMTDIAPGFDAQLASISGKIDAGLAAAGTDRSRIVRLDGFAARTVGAGKAWPAIAAAFPDVSAQMSLSLVDGYSHEDKRIEIETTLRG